jgi:hypothetical protein
MEDCAQALGCVGDRRPRFGWSTVDRAQKLSSSPTFGINVSALASLSGILDLLFLWHVL